MKIGIDTLFESPAFPTGATGYMTNILRCLAKMDTENEYFLFVSEANRHLYQIEQKNVHHVTCWSSNERRGMRIATQQLQSPALIRKYGIEVFNSPGNTAPLLMPCPSVLTIKTMHHYHFSNGIGWQRTMFRRAFVYASAKRATMIIANSQSNRDDIINLLKVDPHMVTIVYEAVNRACFRQDLPDETVQAVLRAKGLCRPYLLNVSSFWPYKNHITLVRAFADLVRQERIPHDLVFVGGSDQPDYGRQVREAVAECGLNERVRFVGYLPHSQVACLYRGADVFVYPSLSETFGLTLLEAMSCGTPVVCSDRGSLPEIAGDAALIINPERTDEISAGILSVLRDGNARADLVRKGSRRACEFSWDAAAANTLAVFLRAGAQADRHNASDCASLG
jgi:glycosyltransferase involved in cell wall biosynthesis